MHAQRIIQELLSTECPSIHARRRACVAAMTEAGSKGGLNLMGMSQKQARTQKEPWLPAVSPQLAALDARTIVTTYAGRMPIEQTFRDVKNPRWGLGLSDSQTRQPQRLATLLLIGALACYALWLIGLALRSNGYRIEYGSRKKAATALSVISLARWWAAENPIAMLSRRRLHAALALLRAIALVVRI